MAEHRPGASVLLIGIILFPLVWLFWLVFTIIGTVKTSSGEDFRYPLSIPFIK